MSDQSTIPATSQNDSREAISEYAFDSTEQKKAPQLSHRSLTIMLSLMCLIPVVTIAVLWGYLPAVHEGQLEANVIAKDLPGKDFYSIDYYDRPTWERGFIILQNKSDLDWTHLEVRVNGNYQVYDRDPIPAHGERTYDLARFLNRTGARFSLQYNELNRIRIYARRPTKDRATYVQTFQTHFPISSNYWPSIILLSVFLVLGVIAAILFAKISKAQLQEA
jgi:hypothetical protein